jgi:hypothetical protein
MVTISQAQLPPPPPSLSPEITIYDSVTPALDLKLLFGGVTQGGQSDQMVTIKNDGNGLLEIGTIAQANQVAEPFSIINDDCSMRNLQPSSTCLFTVRFSPHITGSFIDNINIPSNDSDENPATITLSGNGLPSISNYPPYSPQLVFPADKQDNLATILMFSWNKSSDPDGDLVSYDLYVCEDDAFTRGCINETGIASRVDMHVYYAGMDGNGTGLLLLAGFMLIAGIPLDRQKISLLISIMVIAGILLISCGSGGGGGGGSSGDATPADTGATSDEVSQAVSGLKGGTAYYWKVVAKDNEGGESDSDVRNLTTK